MSSISESKKLYDIAYNLQYNEGKEDEAIAIYKRLIEEFPTSPEENYAQSQINNIQGSLLMFENSLEEWEKHKESQKEIKRKQDEDERIWNAKWVDPPVILTTAPSLEGYRINDTIEVITAECAFGMNLFYDFFASVTDVFGGRSESTQKVLRDTRKTCLLELKREALKIGANAVIAVDLDYSEFSGKGKSMMFLVASGTAVKVEKI